MRMKTKKKIIINIFLISIIFTLVSDCLYAEKTAVLDFEMKGDSSEDNWAIGLADLLEVSLRSRGCPLYERRHIRFLLAERQLSRLGYIREEDKIQTKLKGMDQLIKGFIEKTGEDTFVGTVFLVNAIEGSTLIRHDFKGQYPKDWMICVEGMSDALMQKVKFTNRPSQRSSGLKVSPEVCALYYRALDNFAKGRFGNAVYYLRQVKIVDPFFIPAYLWERKIYKICDMPLNARIINSEIEYKKLDLSAVHKNLISSDKLRWLILSDGVLHKEDIDTVYDGILKNDKIEIVAHQTILDITSEKDLHLTGEYDRLRGNEQWMMVDKILLIRRIDNDIMIRVMDAVSGHIYNETFCASKILNSIFDGDFLMAGQNYYNKIYNMNNHLNSIESSIPANILSVEHTEYSSSNKDVSNFSKIFHDYVADKKDINALQGLMDGQVYTHSLHAALFSYFGRQIIENKPGEKMDPFKYLAFKVDSNDDLILPILNEFKCDPPKNLEKSTSFANDTYGSSHIVSNIFKYNLAMLYFLKHKYLNSQKIYEELLTSLPLSEIENSERLLANIYYFYAVCLKENKDIASALSYSKKAKEFSLVNILSEQTVMDSISAVYHLSRYQHGELFYRIIRDSPIATLKCDGLSFKQQHCYNGAKLNDLINILINEMESSPDSVLYSVKIEPYNEMFRRFVDGEQSISYNLARVVYYAKDLKNLDQLSWLKFQDLSTTQVEDYKKAVQVIISTKKTNFDVGEVSFYAGNWDLARVEFEKSIVYDPLPNKFKSSIYIAEMDYYQKHGKIFADNFLKKIAMILPQNDDINGKTAHHIIIEHLFIAMHIFSMVGNQEMVEKLCNLANSAFYTDPWKKIVKYSSMFLIAQTHCRNGEFFKASELLKVIITDLHGQDLQFYGKGVGMDKYNTDGSLLQTSQQFLKTIRLFGEFQSIKNLYFIHDGDDIVLKDSDGLYLHFFNVPDHMGVTVREKLYKKREIFSDLFLKLYKYPKFFFRHESPDLIFAWRSNLYYKKEFYAQDDKLRFRYTGLDIDFCNQHRKIFCRAILDFTNRYSESLSKFISVTSCDLDDTGILLLLAVSQTWTSETTTNLENAWSTLLKSTKPPTPEALQCLRDLRNHSQKSVRDRVETIAQAMLLKL